MKSIILTIIVDVASLAIWSGMIYWAESLYKNGDKFIAYYFILAVLSGVLEKAFDTSLKKSKK